MKSQEFVNLIKVNVVDAAAEDMVAILASPPGRRKSIATVDRSKWFNGLSDQERDYVVSVINDAVRASAFGVLAVIDGVRVIDKEKGHFELFYVNEDRVLLNPPDLDLHDLLP